MSISPKVLYKGKDEYTTFHMNIFNGSDEDIEGYISYKITMPNGKVDIKEFDRIEKIKANSEVNLYDKYYIRDDFVTGRYFVDGRFFWEDQNILSDTNKNDYFDIKE